MRAPMETPISGKLAANVFLGKAAFGKEKRRQKDPGHLHVECWPAGMT